MLNLRFISVAIFHFASASIVFGGSANATIQCTSQDGLILAGEIPGDFTEFNLSLSNGKSTFEVSDKNGKIFVTEDFTENVFGFVVDRKDNPPLQLYAIPKTMKGRGSDASFEAVLRFAPDPQDPNSYQKMQQNVSMGCRYHYSI